MSNTTLDYFYYFILLIEKLNGTVKFEVFKLVLQTLYQICGYNIVSIDEYLAAPENYSEIDEMSFCMGEEFCKKIVYKKVVKKI